MNGRIVFDLDGTLIDSVAFAGPIAVNDQPLEIGRRITGPSTWIYSDGDIDEPTECDCPTTGSYGTAVDACTGLLSVLDTPQTIGRIPPGGAISTNFAWRCPRAWR